MRGFVYGLAIVAGLCAAAGEAPAGTGKKDCSQPAPVAAVLPVAPPAVAVERTYTTPATTYRTPDQQFTYTVPGRDVVVPGKTYTVTESVVPAAAPVALATVPATSAVATATLRTHTDVYKKARLRTFLRNRDARAIEQTTTVVETPPEVRRRSRSVERRVDRQVSRTAVETFDDGLGDPHP